MMGGMIGNLLASGERIWDNPSLKSDHSQSKCQELQLIRVFGTDKGHRPVWFRHPYRLANPLAHPLMARRSNNCGPQVPETITIDGSDANEAAIKRDNEAYGTHIIIRQVKYLNNMVEQDHRGVKRVTRPMLGFKSFDAA